jgi:uncharacterized protein
MNKKTILLSIAVTAILCAAKYSFSMNIFQALRSGDIENLKDAIASEKNINRGDEDGFSPLFLACEKNKKEFVELLLKHGASKSVNEINEYGESPLSAACEKNNAEIVAMLIPYCTADTINEASKEYETPIYWACWNNNKKILEMLFERLLHLVSKKKGGGEVKIVNY